MGASSLRSLRLRVALIASAILFVVSIPAAAIEHLSEGDYAVVSGTNGYGLNVRSAPDTNSDVHFIADEGTVMQVTAGPQEADGLTWYGVHVDGYNAWVISDFVSEYQAESEASEPSEAFEVEEPVAEESVVVGHLQVVNTNGHGLRLRAEPTSTSETLTVLTEGTTLAVIGAEQTDADGVTWANVQYNGTAGYAHHGYLGSVDAGSDEVATEPAEPEQPAQNEPEPAVDEDQQPAEEPAADAGGAEDEAAQEEPEALPEPEAEPAPEPVAPNGVAVGGNAEIVNTDGFGLNIRHGAGFGQSVVTVAAEGHVVQVIGGPETGSDGSSWWQVDYRGLGGWAHGDYLQATNAEPTGAGSGSGQSSNDQDIGNGNVDEAPAASSTGQQIASEAMKYLGYPYVWGGTTPAGFDCSGFLYYVVNQVTGGGFPRGMEAQVNRGTHVPSDQLQPGDIVFQQNTYQWGLSHAGIYIGNGQFIHAATPGSGVVISDLWDSYWGPRYYTARRIS